MDLTRGEEGRSDRTGVAALPSIMLPGSQRSAPQGLDLSAEPMQVSAAIDGSDNPIDVLDLLILEGFTSGRQPFARARHVANLLPGADLMPAGARVIRDATNGRDRSRLATGPGWTIRVTRWHSSSSASITVTAISAELADEQLASAISGAVKPKPKKSDSRVAIGFWHVGPHGPRRIRRDIKTQAWGRIRGNYSETVATSMDPVMALSGKNLRGRLLLVHGPPGTGKTSLMRTLARSWRTWCQMDCVLDPERLFGDPSYLLNVALGDDSGPSWRLLLLEDCDELIRGEAKFTSGQQLSRLLNLTDGLLGQGRRVLVAITTNEPLAALHPAIVRPGRALAQVEVGRLSRAESAAWLARAGADHSLTAKIGPDGATLAELFALRSGADVAALAPVEGPGLYL